MRTEDSPIMVVTTCNASGYKEYGRKMMETFQQYWDRDIILLFYNEGIENLPTAPNIIHRELPEWFIKWKDKHKNNKRAHGRDGRYNRKTRAYDFRLDCIKFSHKVAALTDIGSQVKDGLLIWIDADTLAHQRVDPQWLWGLNERKDSYLAWLNRKRPYPECGFMMFNCWMDCHLRFMSLLRDTYESDKVFSYDETHDSFVINQLVTKGILEGWMPKTFNLSGNYETKHHPFVFSKLGDRLDHAKGARKRHGRTLPSELKRRRTGDYWKP